MQRKLTHQIPDGPAVRVYDNGGKTLDRYSVVIEGDGWQASPGMVSMLGLSSDPTRGFSQFTEGQEGRHLGKRIAFTDLFADVQRHIVGRLATDAEMPETDDDTPDCNCGTCTPPAYTCIRND